MINFSKWILTNKGEDNQAWMRYLNSDYRHSMEPYRQIIFLKGNKYKLAEGDDKLKYPPVTWDTAEEAKIDVDKFTVDLMMENPQFDVQKMSAWHRCMDMIDTEDPFMVEQASNWLDHEASTQSDVMMTARENGRICEEFYKTFVK